MLYSSDTHSSWNLAGIQNSQDDVIINLVMGPIANVLAGGNDVGRGEGWRGDEWSAGGRGYGGAG